MMEILIVCAAIAAISLVVAALVALCKEYILPFFIEGWNKGREKRRQQGNEVVHHLHNAERSLRWSIDALVQFASAKERG